ncbi:rhodanese-like domain-containing protein 11, chloroplastic isoform X1 [Ananas comosus]|uniref:Rhodanese-like domain-containing protein 11, chloroplastic isoform X1 n=2 Tax=Ananas comosus TaxID=4615 RepID=A0A6P5EK26_ANACO|nr:rhodanese-like domain-containing protein 11, chloroplastic isoform X1 [Ananas comosus]
MKLLIRVYIVPSRMEALGHSFPTAIVFSRPTRRDCRCGSSSWNRLPGRGFASPSKKLSTVIKMGAAVGGEEEEETRQAKEMAAARRRWETLIREQKVKVLTPREAGYAIQLSNKVLLDVRPSVERNKAWVKGSTWIPIFDVDNNVDFGALSKQITNFVMGGWWSGSPTLAYDKSFIPKVEEKFSKDTDIIVACQKGLRSLAACEQLYNAGFRNLFWIQGGLEAAEEELDRSATCVSCERRMELSISFHRPSDWPYYLSGCVVSWDSKVRPSASRTALSLRGRFSDFLWCCRCVVIIFTACGEIVYNFPICLELVESFFCSYVQPHQKV